MPMTSTTPRVRPSPTNGHNCRRLFRGRRSISAALRPPLLDCSRAVTGSVRCATSQSPPHGWMPGQLHEPAFGTSRPSEVDRDCSAGQRSRAVQRHPGSPLVSAPSAPLISEHVADAAALAHVHLREGQVDTHVLVAACDVSFPLRGRLRRTSAMPLVGCCADERNRMKLCLAVPLPRLPVVSHPSPSGAPPSPSP